MGSLEEILAHHGVKGMKWGVRRDRGGDGGAKAQKAFERDKKFLDMTRDDERRRHTNQGGKGLPDEAWYHKDLKKLEADRDARIAKSAKTPGSEDAEKVKAHMERAKTKGTKDLTNKELQELVNRMNLEQQYSRLSPGSNPVKKGQAHVKEGLAVFGTVSAVYAAATSPAGKAIGKAIRNIGKPSYVQQKIF